MAKARLGRRVASGSAWVQTLRRSVRSARDVTARGALAWNVLLNPCFSIFFSKNLY
jgi:hypothetical protein